MRIAVSTERAPKAVGPYSQAVKIGGFVWVSGQIPLDPASGGMVEGGIEEQTRQVLDNVRNVLAAAPATMKHVARCTVYLTDLGQFDAMNRVYETYFEPPFPARACVEVSKLPKGALVEMDAIAIKPAG